MWFLRWFLETFTTGKHFRRFLGTAILGITVLLICREKPMPEGWWLAVGAVIGYFFGGKGKTGKGAG
jgi:presenilin-like A22 family membrane protease